MSVTEEIRKADEKWWNECNHYTYDEVKMVEKVLRENPSIKKIIFNDPAVIIMWNDGTKTVTKVQTEEDEYNKTAGINYCIAKKFLSSKDYNSYVELVDLLKHPEIDELIDSYENERA